MILLYCNFYLNIVIIIVIVMKLWQFQHTMKEISKSPKLKILPSNRFENDKNNNNNNYYYINEAIILI